jgi:hypothetical protein
MMPKSTRTSLQISSTFDMVMKLAEGNVGCLTLLLQLARDDAETDPTGMDTILFLLCLDDLNMRGEQIYVAHAECDDAPKFRERIMARDPDLIEVINTKCPRDSGEQAFSGASFKRNR